MKTVEILRPAKFNGDTVLQATNEDGELLGLYLDSDTRIIPTSGEWKIIRWGKRSKEILADILDSLEGHGLASDWDGSRLTVNI